MNIATLEQKLLEFNLISENKYDKNEELLHDFIENTKIKSDKPKILLFASYEFGLDFITQNSSYLSTRFDLFKIFTNAMMDIPENYFFKAIFSIKRDFYLLKWIIKECGFDLVIVSNIGLNYHWYAPFFREFCNIKTVVIEKDFTTFTTMVHCQKADIFSSYVDSTVERIEFERECEKYTLEQCDGIITNMGGEFFDTFVLEHSKKAFFYLPMRDPSIYKFENVSNRERDKVAYCGTMEPVNTQIEYGREADFYSIFNSFITLGFRVDAYSLTDIERLSGYYELGSKFHLFKALEVHKLIDAIKNARFGSMVLNTPLISDELKMSYNYIFPTKLFTYLAAGLPVVVNNEYTAVKKMLEEHGMGIGVYADEIERGHDIVSDSLWRAMLDGVAAFQKSGMYYTQQIKLGDFFYQIIQD